MLFGCNNVPNLFACAIDCDLMCLLDELQACATFILLYCFEVGGVLNLGSVGGGVEEVWMWEVLVTQLGGSVRGGM